MKKNILFVSHSAELYGAERMLLQILERIDKAKFNPSLILPAHGPFEGEAKRFNIPTVRIPFKWWITEKSKAWKQPLSWVWNIKSVLSIVKIIRKKKISLVFSNSSVVCGGAFAARMLRVPHVWSVHEILRGSGSLVSFLLGNRIFVRWMSHLSTRIIVNSLATGSGFGRDEKVRLIYSGLDTPSHDFPPKSELRQALDLDEQDVVLGMVGKVYRGKGQKEVILAFDELHRQHPHLRLLIVGEIKDRTYYQEIDRIVNRRNLRKYVRFLGYRSDVFNIMRCLDMLIVASVLDSFGLVALEAMAVGTPVLAAAKGGLPELIIPGQNGFLLESTEPERIAEGVKNILRNPSKVAEIRQHGQMTVKEKFTLERYIQEVEDVIEVCLG